MEQAWSRVPLSSRVCAKKVGMVLLGSLEGATTEGLSSRTAACRRLVFFGRLEAKHGRDSGTCDLRTAAPTGFGVWRFVGPALPGAPPWAPACLPVCHLPGCSCPWRCLPEIEHAPQSPKLSAELRSSSRAHVPGIFLSCPPELGIATAGMGLVRGYGPRWPRACDGKLCQDVMATVVVGFVGSSSDGGELQGVCGATHALQPATLVLVLLLHKKRNPNCDFRGEQKVQRMGTSSVGERRSLLGRSGSQRCGFPDKGKHGNSKGGQERIEASIPRAWQLRSAATLTIGRKAASPLQPSASSGKASHRRHLNSKLAISDANKHMALSC